MVLKPGSYKLNPHNKVKWWEDTEYFEDDDHDLCKRLPDPDEVLDFGNVRSLK